MKKILIIGYGGTIMMVINKTRNVVVPAEHIEDILRLLPSLHEVANVDFKLLANVDSTNVTPEDWTQLAQYIFEHHDQYDGFVVTHGTNTMAYTASALSLALGQGLKKPIVLTGSQLPLTVYGNDARFNFENALKTTVLASDLGIAEVMIVFDDAILRGSRATKVSESRFRAFESPAQPEIGTILSTGILFHQRVLHADATKPFDLHSQFESAVLTIDLVPGQLPELVDEFLQAGRCKGLLLKSHGAGSVPTIGRYSFLPLIRKATDEYQVPVLVTTKFVGGNAFKKVNDEPAKAALEAGAISTYDMTDVMAQVKLMWLLAREESTNSLRHLIATSFVGEVTPPAI